MSQTEVEIAKLASDGLRGTIVQTLENPQVDGFSEDDRHLIKFHGIYQQKNREKLPPGESHPNSFMVRGRIPGGRLTADQYLQWDKLADLYGGGSIRLTTRQAIQLHGVLKNDLRALMAGLHQMNLSSIAACGDVVRNVTQAVNPWADSDLSLLDEPAQLISDTFKFQSSAWAEVWLGEERIKAPGDELEPVYGPSYLPRKFKIAITLVGNNSVDLYTNDLGLAAVVSDGAIQGYHVFAGGGMGMTHNKANTYPRVADAIGYIDSYHLLSTISAIISVHRDFGDRTNRKHARLKYVIQEQGVEWFRSEVENRQGYAFQQKTLPHWNTPSYLGWQKRTDSLLSLGLSILSGRIRDNKQQTLKSAIRDIVAKTQCSVQVTPDQDLVFMQISPTDQDWVQERLDQSGYAWKGLPQLQDRALACVSLPTCGLALAEAERVLPDLLQSMHQLFEKHGLAHRPPVLRLTGCPNGCARPYAAEIGVVGMLPGKYAIFLGGSPEGERIAKLWKQKVSLEEVPALLEPLVVQWKSQGKEKESFGNFIHRVGLPET